MRRVLTVVALGSTVLFAGGSAAVAAPTATLAFLSMSNDGPGHIHWSWNYTGNPSGDCPPTCSGDVPAGYTFNITAVPDSGALFFKWAGSGCSGTDPNCTFDTNSDNSPIAQFGYQLSVATTGGTGTVTSSDGKINCGSNCTAKELHGTAVTLTATPADGFDFASWGSCPSPSANKCTVTMNSNANITATFRGTPVRVTVAKTGNGTVTSNQSTLAPQAINCGNTCAVDFHKNQSVTLTAQPAAGTYFAGWGGACSGTSPTCTVKVTQATQVTATFRTPTFSLGSGSFAVRWKVSLASGTLSVGGSTSDGADFTLDVKAPDGAAWPTYRFSVQPGSFSQTFPIVSNVLLRRQPGAYSFTLSGRSYGIALAPQTQTVVLAAPKEGVVKQVIFSKTANGPPLKTFPFGTKKVYVRFIFSAKPTKGPLKVLWTQPDGSVLLRINKRITPVVSTWVASNHPLRKGTWHALLQARGVRVASAAVKIV